jgi:hypothetical protein
VTVWRRVCIRTWFVSVVQYWLSAVSFYILVEVGNIRNLVWFGLVWRLRCTIVTLIFPLTILWCGAFGLEWCVWRCIITVDSYSGQGFGHHICLSLTHSVAHTLTHTNTNSLSHSLSQSVRQGTGAEIVWELSVLWAFLSCRSVFVVHAYCMCVRGRAEGQVFSLAAPLRSLSWSWLRCSSLRHYWDRVLPWFLTVNPQIFMDTVPYFVVLAGSSGSYRQPPSILNTFCKGCELVRALHLWGFIVSIT